MRKDEKMQAARERIRMTIIERNETERLIQPPMKPRYDEVYFEGVEMLDGLKRVTGKDGE